MRVKSVLSRHFVCWGMSFVAVLGTTLGFVRRKMVQAAILSLHGRLLMSLLGGGPAGFIGVSLAFPSNIMMLQTESKGLIRLQSR